MTDKRVDSALAQVVSVFLQEVAAHAADCQPKKMHLVMDIPAEWVTMAAWTYIRREHRLSGEHDKPQFLGNSAISFPPEYAHKAKTKAMFKEVLESWFNEKFDALYRLDDESLFSFPDHKNLEVNDIRLEYEIPAREY